MFDSVLQSLMAGLPVMVLHFAVTIVMLVIGIRVYTLITPYNEFALIRQGNVAAAVSLAGASLGLAIPLAFCMAASVNTLDIVLWGAAALAIQLLGFKVTDWLLKDLGASMLICSCGARFPYADPMEPAEYKSWVATQSELRTSRRVILALFFITLLGLPAPLCGPMAGYFAFSRRDLLAGADGTYLAMAYGAAALGLTYAVVILALMGSAILGA